MISLKCDCIKYTKNKCRNNSFLVINDYSYCLNHALLLYNKYVIIIQKNYRGYKVRRYLKNIFYKLMPELREIIIYYINHDYYKKKYLNIISSIIVKKTYNLHDYKNLNEKLSIQYLYNCYKLYSKYYSIIPINYLKHAYILGNQISSLCDILLYHDQIVFTYNYLIFDKIELFNLYQYEIYNLFNIINRFLTIHSFNNSLYDLH